MNYLLGDVQGCCGAMERLLDQVGFSASRDHLYVLGDLVNRGPRSLDTLRRLRGYGDAASCLLGNHDLNLLAIAQGVRRPHAGDTLDEILEAPDRDAWLEWLRHRRMAMFEHGWLMVHAGVVPEWDAAQVMALAAEVEAMMQSDRLERFLPAMYGDRPAKWADDLAGAERWRVVINVLTRTRYLRADGSLDFEAKEGAAQAPPGLTPWFDMPGRCTAGTPIAFGHWASLGLVDRPDLLALDTGCVWGRQLSIARIDGAAREVIQVECGTAR